MADIIKFVLPLREEAVVIKTTVLTDEEFVTRMGRIAKTAEGALAAIQISIDDAPWTSDHAQDLAILSRELGNLFELASDLIAQRAALKD
jgi:hypothetical protein